MYNIQKVYKNIQSTYCVIGGQMVRYTFEEYMKKFKIKSRSTVYNHEKEKKIQFFRERNRTYIIPVQSFDNLDISDNGINLLSSLENLQNENLNISEKLINQKNQTEFLAKDIKILNAQIEGKEALIKQLDNENKNLLSYIKSLENQLEFERSTINKLIELKKSDDKVEYKKSFLGLYKKIVP